MFKESVVIKSEAALQVFLERWKENRDFTAAVAAAKVNFKANNVVFYFHSASSGSYRISADQPVWENNNILVLVNNDTPRTGGPVTADMAGHGYAYILNKSVPKVIFRSYKDVVEIPNS